MKTAVCFVRVTLGACALALIAIVQVSAQGVGAKVGVTLSTVAIDPSDALGLDVRGQAGFLGGGFVTFGAEARIGFQADVVVALRRVTFGDDIEDKLTYLEVPVVARVSVLRRESLGIHAVGGASLGYLLQARESIKGADSADIKEAMEAFEVAALVGAQATWNDRWVFEGRYVFGLTEAYQELPEGIRTRQRGFQVTAGYRFR